MIFTLIIFNLLYIKKEIKLYFLISFYAHENKVIFKVIFCTTTCVALFAVLEI